MRLYSVRFLWRKKDSDSVFFKIITDVESGLKAFCDALLVEEGVVSAAYEYLNEINVSHLGEIKKIIDKGE